ncbi:uncharacterized protein LOC127867830 [Dreissena polymorpha]|uniref:NACHT domain-containing protein n=1 Tax=Dreissena polymorpha TaxID=45954 RepID=A0A9D4M2R4_DREPO|nr:uncharacterized protein LOC127867830 [Dreissena polymorpha]XP_052265277.1 uncharacterized protein LOC127867830 [Dreissena polymorpha]XP_052265278.1 uncharacterized protein LOC127867830 [Dreissena polymorpha]KAH3868624.1 hypothetical protein DPMN_031775 [Dreissena polymorpha]
MVSLADVFTESERTNWLKVWLAIDIAKSGLEQFVENEAKTLHGNIYNAILPSGAVACIGCLTANLLKCPSPGLCNKRGAHSPCTSMHDTPLKQPRPCPANVCTKVLVEIQNQHKFSNPSWKNTLANHWATCPWQIAKAYLPPDGYTEKSSVQDTDLNGIISFMMNCKHFNNKFSFPIASGKTQPPCLLTKARELCRTARHSSTCKVTDTDLQDIFMTLTSLLTDTLCLAHDVAAREAVRKLAQLQTDVLKLTTEEIVNLLEAAQDKLQKVENITETAIDEIRIYIENCRKDLSAHTDTFKLELSEHTGKCKKELDGHFQKSTESNYYHFCEDFRRRLKALYNETSSHGPLSNLRQSIDKHITDIYGTPKLHRIQIDQDGKRLQKERVLTYKEIFNLADNSNRRIYLQGEPGSGKSTFSAMLVHDWSHGNEVSSAYHSETTAFDDVLTIQKFKFLFLITLRDARRQTDVTEMIKKQLIDTTFSEDERADVYRRFVQIMNTEICLVIREGLDEWIPPDGSKLTEPSMAEIQTNICTILTTSRPWKLSDELIKNLQIESLLQIDGISDPYTFSENIIRCIIDQTKDIVETAHNFELFVEDRELESLSSSPMLYTLVICTWVNSIERDETFKGSPSCALYTTLLESLCKNANSVTGYFNDLNPPPVRCFSGTSYIQPNIKHLNKLADIACKFLFSSERESSIVFNDITLSNYFSPDEFEVFKAFALNAGILTNRKDKSQTGSANSFVHKTVQELLAAYHIACNPYVIDGIISMYLERPSTSYLDISQVFIFLCGMNISAANKLSTLLDQYDVTHYHFENWNPSDPCVFQSIIQSGIREAAASNQDGIQLKLSQFHIDDSNIRDLNDIWSTNKFNTKVLYVKIYPSDFSSSSTRGEPRSNFEFDLSSCPKLKALCLSGSDIWLTDTASPATTQFPVRIVLNRTDSAPCADPSIVLSSIEYINLEEVTCSSTCLRSLFSTLLTLDHEVRCELHSWNIKSCGGGSDIRTSANITTGLNNKLNVQCLWNDSPGLWESILGLNINSLSLSGQFGGWTVNHVEAFSKSLASLTQLETLCISLYEDSPGLLESLRGLNIKSLSLEFVGLILNHGESFSQSLTSLTQLDTLSISVYEDSPSLWEAVHGLKIKSLKLSDEFGGLRVSHLESLSQSLSSLTQLEKLTIHVYKYIDIQLPQSLRYLTIYCNELHQSELRNLLNKMYVCTQPIESRLEFGCESNLEFGCTSFVHIKHSTLEKYTDIQQELEQLKNVNVKRFRIYDRRPGSDTWSVRDIGVVDDDDNDDDSVYYKKYNYFLCKMDPVITNRISMRLQIMPASVS